jgi:signal transduction histidine kinase
MLSRPWRRSTIDDASCGSPRAESDNVLITVTDSGTGIDPEHKDRIFEAFFTTKSSGMGMGLSICRSIVQAHGGQLSVAPAMPNGSTFSILLSKDGSA